MKEHERTRSQMDYQWIGHRGCIQKPWIENTTSALEYAILQGAQAVEVDVWWDGEGYRVFHDDDARRLRCKDLDRYQQWLRASPMGLKGDLQTDQSESSQDPLSVQYWDADQWNNWEWPEGAPVERLDDMWNRWAWKHPSVVWNIEFKGKGSGKPWADWLMNRWSQRLWSPQGWVSSFHWKECQDFQEAQSVWFQKESQEALGDWTSVLQWDVGLLIDEHHRVEDLSEALDKGLNVMSYGISVQENRKEWLEVLKQEQSRGAQVFVWSVDSQEDERVESWMRWGVNGFFKNQWE